LEESSFLRAAKLKGGMRFTRVAECRPFRYGSEEKECVDRLTNLDATGCSGGCYGNIRYGTSKPRSVSYQFGHGIPLKLEPPDEVAELPPVDWVIEGKASP
jgi:hypothetical protein